MKIIDKMKLDDGREIIIRFPEKNDAKEAWKFYNKVIKETESLSRITPVSLKDEKKWVDEVILKMKKKKSVNLFAEHDGKIIGSASIERKTDQRKSHVGRFGICILQEFTGIGLGRRMMTEIEKESRKMKLEVLELDVFGKNKIAQKLYNKMGFTSIGEIPRSVKIKDGYDSDIIMYKVLR